MIAIDLATHPKLDDRFGHVRRRVGELLAYMDSANKRPSEVRIYPNDHKHIIRSANSQLRKKAKDQDRLENERRKAHGLPGKVKSDADKVGSINYAGTPVVPGATNSRPRKVKP